MRDYKAAVASMESRGRRLNFHQFEWGDIAE